MFNINRDINRYIEIAGLLLSKVITGLSFSFISYIFLYKYFLYFQTIVQLYKSNLKKSVKNKKLNSSYTQIIFDNIFFLNL